MAHRARLRRRGEEAQGILVAALDRPEAFRFQAGQWCFLTLPDLGLHDERGLRRHLSLASAPEDRDLVFATKLSPSAFKQTLARLEPGAEILLEEPRGAFGLPDDAAAPLIFLAGGIGITPFRSMLRHAAQARTGHRIAVLYSNRTPEEAVFLEDLLGLSRAHPDLRVVATMTRMHDSAVAWDGPTGRLDATLIQDQCPEWGAARYFLAGPPPMADAMAATLAAMGIAGERVRVEEFSGY